MKRMESSLMRLHEYRILLVVVTVIVALLVASPALSRLTTLPRTEFFTEMWILGPNHEAQDYPFNITRGHNYDVFLGVGNHLGYFAYYLVEVKFRNQTQSAPNSFNRTSSSLPSLFNITAFVADEETWELPVTISFDYGYNATLTQVSLHIMILNGIELDMHPYTIEWDSKNSGCLGSLFFELWIYNAATSSFQYHERFVDLWLNMTT
jgi:uncharacterized membrane protein